MNKYQFENFVGRGAYGLKIRPYACFSAKTNWIQFINDRSVRLYKRLSDELAVIIKEIPVEDLSKDERQSALNEAKVHSSLNHVNVIRYYESFIENKSLMIVMEYGCGGTLAQFIEKRHGQLIDENLILSYFAQLVSAIHYVHSKQVMHRDLKPANILLTRDKRILKVSDFGISKMMTSKTKASTVIGTPAYLSPELCTSKPYNQKTDCWSMGCVVYELCTLHRAFEAENHVKLAMRIAACKYLPISDQYSTGLRRLVDNLLCFDPDQRLSVSQLLSEPLLLPYYVRLLTDTGRIMPSRPWSLGSAQRAGRAPLSALNSTRDAMPSRTSPSLPTTSASPPPPPSKLSHPPDIENEGQPRKGSLDLATLDFSASSSGAAMSLFRRRSSNNSGRFGSFPSHLPDIQLHEANSNANVASSRFFVFHWGKGCFPQLLPLPHRSTALTQVAVSQRQQFAVSATGRILLWVPSSSGATSSNFDQISLSTTSSTRAPSINISNSDFTDQSMVSGNYGGGANAPYRADYMDGQSGVVFRKIACAILCAITDRGLLMTCGDGAQGMLGHGSFGDVAEPQIVESLIGREVVEVACGSAHVLCLTDRQQVFGWGCSDHGRLGLGFQTSEVLTTPKRIPWHRFNSPLSSSEGNGNGDETVDDLAPASVRIEALYCGIDCSALLAVHVDGTEKRVLLVTGRNGRSNKFCLAMNASAETLSMSSQDIRKSGGFLIDPLRYTSSDEASEILYRFQQVPLFSDVSPFGWHLSDLAIGDSFNAFVLQRTPTTPDHQQPSSVLILAGSNDFGQLGFNDTSVTHTRIVGQWPIRFVRCGDAFTVLASADG